MVISQPVFAGTKQGDGVDQGRHLSDSRRQPPPLCLSAPPSTAQSERQCACGLLRARGTWYAAAAWHVVWQGRVSSPPDVAGSQWDPAGHSVTDIQSGGFNDIV